MNTFKTRNFFYRKAFLSPTVKRFRKITEHRRNVLLLV